MRLLCCFLLLFMLNIPYAACSAPLSLNIVDGELKSVLRSIAKLANYNIIVDESVHGRLTVDLQGMLPESALDLIARNHNLDYFNDNGVIVVTTTEKIRKNYPVTRVWKLNYAKACDIKDSLQNITTNGKLSTDQITNSVIFSGSPTDMRNIRFIIEKLDVPTKQVTIEAKIIAFNKEYTKKLGLAWSWDALPQYDSDARNDIDFKGNFKIFHNYGFRFNAVLNALIADGKAKLLARPRMITIPGQEAKIFIGDHIPVQTEKHNNDGSYLSTEYLDAGIKLLFTPIVSSDGSMITASVHTEVSTPTLISELKNYRITSRTADTNVRLKSGETLVIGGLITEDEQNNLQKVPFLSNIPIIGELFKNRTRSRSKTEVIMLLTPYITDAGDSPAIYNNNLNGTDLNNLPQP